MNYFENGQAVATCDPEVYRDEPEPEPERQVDPITALLAVVFELGQWAANDPVKGYAARVVMRQETRSTSHFAREAGVSTSYVRRMIREARKLIGSAPEAA